MTMRQRSANSSCAERKAHTRGQRCVLSLHQKPLTFSSKTNPFLRMMFIVYGLDKWIHCHWTLISGTSQVTLPDTHFVALTSLLFSNHQDHENNGFKVRKSTYSLQNGWTGLHFWCFEDKVFGTSTIQNFCPRSNPLRMVCNRAEACEEVKFMSKADDPNCLMQSVGQIVVQDLIGFIWFNCKMTFRLRGVFILTIWVSLVSPKSPSLQVS